MTPWSEGNKKYGDQTGDSLLLCLTITKLTDNEFYCYKIEVQQFFPLRTLVITVTSRFTDYISNKPEWNNCFIKNAHKTLHSENIIHESRLYFMSFPDSCSVCHAKPLPDPNCLLHAVTYIILKQRCVTYIYKKDARTCWWDRVMRQRRRTVVCLSRIKNSPAKFIICTRDILLSVSEYRYVDVKFRAVSCDFVCITFYRWYRIFQATEYSVYAGRWPWLVWCRVP